MYRYGSPILDIKWHQTLNSEGPKLITTDNHIVRIWDPDTVRNYILKHIIYLFLFYGVDVFILWLGLMLDFIVLLSRFPLSAG